MNCEAIFLENLQLIEEVIRFTCRRHLFQREEAEDFASVVKVKLIDNDYEVLREFEGKSNLRTYLATVIHHQSLDYRISNWGKWRPSAEARRVGPVAIQLERLMQRDGYTLDQAVEILRTNHGLKKPQRDLYKIAARLPQRNPRRFESIDQQPDFVSEVVTAEGRLIERERRGRRRRAEAVLNRLRMRLGEEDRLLLKMRFEDSLTVARIARSLQLEQRPLYRRYEKLYGRLRTELQKEGVREEDLGFSSR
ncbi:MAG: sigma-70 family RNA polymerase sigma factor [Acidobacteriota bacterium]